MMSQEWYYAKGDHKQGPITSGQLKTLATSGGLLPTDLVWTEGMTDWRQASFVKGLMPPRRTAPPPSTPTTTVTPPPPVPIATSPIASPPAFREKPVDTPTPNHNIPLITGLVGCLFLIVGPFLPLIKMPIVGSLNYIMQGKGDGIMVCLLGLLSLGFILSHHCRWMLIPGVLAGAIVFYDFINVSLRLSDATQEMSHQLADNPFRGIAEAAAATIQWEIGLPVMSVGIILIIVAAAVPAHGFNVRLQNA